MPYARLSRPNQTWAIALASAFVNPAAPTTAELNSRRFVRLISCGLTEDGTEMVLADSDTDDTLVFCSIGNEVTPTRKNVTANLTYLADANTGGSGSTVDLTSLYNEIHALLGAPDIPFWLISRTGPNASQDINFAVGHRIKMALFNTDYPVATIENNVPVKWAQTPAYAGSVNWNYTIAT